MPVCWLHSCAVAPYKSAKPNMSAVWQPFSLSLWACIIATVFLMALVFWLYSHLSVRGAYPVRSARQGRRHCPGLPVVLDMAARMPRTYPVVPPLHWCRTWPASQLISGT